MKKITFPPFVAAAALLLAGSFASSASAQLANLVLPGETFSFSLIGFGNPSSNAYYLTSPQGLTATFGLTQTYTNTVAGAATTLTMTSSQTIGATMTTNTFTLSTPTNFLTQNTVNGTTIIGLQFDLGDSNSGGDAVAVSGQITGYTASGSAVYGTALSGPLTASLTPTTMPGAGNTSYAAAQGVNSSDNSTPIYGYGFRSFTYTISYPNLTAAPEPSTWAMLGVGVIAAGVVAVRRSRTA